MSEFFTRERKVYVIGVVAILLLMIFKPTVAPSKFPANTIITVPEGVGLLQLSEKLESDQVIRSPFWFRLVAIMLGGERRMRAGEYYMGYPQNVFAVAWRMVTGDHDIETIKITVPEGFTVKEISDLFDKRFVAFDHREFENLAPEGYLFPDTYFVPITATASTTIKLMRDNFDRKISQSLPEVRGSQKTLEEVITMASIIESEAPHSNDDRKVISDILWKRIKIGMPLQVDSEMETYEYKGLPPTPIANPGIGSIEAALHPTTTPYLYFLTGDDGTMHYSKTFEEHVEKKFKYIKRS